MGGDYDQSELVMEKIKATPDRNETPETSP
jgi:hypothetical protein